MEYARRPGLVFDVSRVKDRDIAVSDIRMDEVQAGMFVAFYTGHIEKVGYGGTDYFKVHPQLSYELLEALLEKKVSIIGVDCAGVRQGAEHTPMDQRCADQGVFVVENLCNLKALVGLEKPYVINTYPMNYSGMTGLPCRVLAEVD